VRKLFECVIPGQPVVKKNNQRVVFRHGKSIKTDTEAYRAWHTIAVKELTLWSRPSVPIEAPVILKLEFYMQTRRRVDISNLYEGIQDVLVEMRVLADDDCTKVIGHDGSRVYYDKENPRIKVTILKAEEWQPWYSIQANA
jgi:Holliday junction resolvase RusA-like endonuclease